GRVLLHAPRGVAHGAPTAPREHAGSGDRVRSRLAGGDDMTATTVPGQRTGFRQTLRDIYHEHTHFDIIGKSWLWALISGTAVLVSVAALALSGLNLGIDFDGGTQWQL